MQGITQHGITKVVQGTFLGEHHDSAEHSTLIERDKQENINVFLTVLFRVFVAFYDPPPYDSLAGGDSIDRVVGWCIMRSIIAIFGNVIGDIAENVLSKVRLLVTVMRVFLIVG